MLRRAASPSTTSVVRLREVCVTRRLVAGWSVRACDDPAVLMRAMFCSGGHTGVLDLACGALAPRAVALGFAGGCPLAKLQLQKPRHTNPLAWPHPILIELIPTPLCRHHHCQLSLSYAPARPVLTDSHSCGQGRQEGEGHQLGLGGLDVRGHQ